MTKKQRKYPHCLFLIVGILVVLFFQSMKIAHTAEPLKLETIGGRIVVHGPLGDWIAETVLDGCTLEGAGEVKSTESMGVSAVRRMQGPTGQKCKVTEILTPTSSSVRWEIQVESDGEYWTAPIIARLKIPVTTNTQFWTAWMLDANLWKDPLKPVPMANSVWSYGAYFKSGIAIPIASVMSASTDTGMSWVVSPQNLLLETKLLTTDDGQMAFCFEKHRFGKGKSVKLVLGLVAHEADWRGGLRWMVQNYPEFFNPPNPKVHQMAGCGAYPEEWSVPEDVDQLKRMAFNLYWAASYDYAYFGMYLPPVKDEEAWESWRHVPPKKVSSKAQRERARAFHEAGINYLNYFNCSEYGNFKTNAEVDLSASSSSPEPDVWKDQTTFLRKNLKDSLYRDKNGNPSRGGWGESGYFSFIMDPAGVGYQKFLLDQARRHIERIPDAAGFCIDRMWWASPKLLDLQSVNYGADDGVGWYDGRQGRHFSVSFSKFLSQLGPIVHHADKVIFCNPCQTYRLDCYKDVDGFYDEIWAIGPAAAANGTGLLAIRKPAALWTADASWLKPDPDAYFQRHLHLGIYPTVPYPKNDHTISPDPWVDRQYLDYGPLLIAMRGKKWVLAPHCVETTAPHVKVNLFEVPGGYAMPVTFGGTATQVEVVLQNLPELLEEKPFTIEVIHPDGSTPVFLHAKAQAGAMKLTVPFRRGCAMVKLQIPEQRSAKNLSQIEPCYQVTIPSNRRTDK